MKLHSNEEFLKRYRDTQNGCDKNCEECILYTHSKNQTQKTCVHEYVEVVQEWQKKRHEQFHKYLDGYGGSQ